jgi:TonB family protein
MRAQILVAVFLLGAFAASAQDTPTPQPGQLKDPRAILAAAAPFYDFSDPTLKPFHLKATYQLYDDKGNPSEQGTFEYWWVSPKVHRVSWSRPGATRSDWHTAGGKQAYVATGEDLGYFERGLWSALFSPLHAENSTDPAKVVMLRNKLKLGDTEFVCVSLEPAKLPADLQPSNFRVFPTQCFDSTLPVLRIGFSSDGVVVTAFDNVTRFQGKFLARAIQEVVGQQKLFSVSVDSIDTLSPADPALVPTKDAIFKPDSLHSAGNVETGALVKKRFPVYPRMAKLQGLQGNVLVEVTIGIDGKVKDPRVIFSSSPLFSAAGLDCVSQWEYEPSLQNGVPIEIHTLINLVFTLGR